MTKYEDEAELCEYCGDTPEDCADAGECNYGVVDDNCTFCSTVCRCDENYDAQREREADEFFDSLDSWH